MINRERMSATFIKLFNSIYDTSYKTVSAIFDAENKKRIDETFNVQAVASGLRNMGIMSNHLRGWDGSAFGLHVAVIPGFKNATFIANKKALSEANFKKILADYNDQMSVQRLEISDAPITSIMNKHLGYLFPYPKNKADGVLRTVMHIPGKTELDSNGYGGQMLNFTPKLGETIKVLQDKWNKLAKTIHDDFHIEFRLVIY